jgi:hypothetical protein
MKITLLYKYALNLINNNDETIKIGKMANSKFALIAAKTAIRTATADISKFRLEMKRKFIRYHLEKWLRNGCCAT